MKIKVSAVGGHNFKRWAFSGFYPARSPRRTQTISVHVPAAFLSLIDVLNYFDSPAVKANSPQLFDAVFAPIGFYPDLHGVPFIALAQSCRPPEADRVISARTHKTRAT